MKKIVLTWFACCLLFAGVSAQDTVFTAQKRLSGIDKVVVSGKSQLHVIYGSDSAIVLAVNSQTPLKEAEAFKVFTRTDLKYRNVSQPYKETLRSKTKMQVLELLAEDAHYVLLLGKENVIIQGEENASITYTSTLGEEIKPLSVKLENNASFHFMPSNQKKYTLSKLSVELEDQAKFYENMPLEINSLLISTSDNGRYIEYEDATGGRRVRNKVVYTSENEVVPIDSVSIADTVSEQSAFRQAWNEFGDMLESVTDLKQTTRSRPNYWYNKWELYWGFLGWQFVVPTYHLMYPYDESPDLHVSFSSFTWEIKECYRFKYRHDLIIGLGVSWDNYRLPTPTNNSITNIAGDSLNSTYQKGKVRVGYVQLPIGYGFQRKNGGFNFALEVIPGYVMNAIQKTTWESSDSKYVFKQGVRDRVEPWKLDARLTLGWSWGSIYVQPSLLPVVVSNGDKLYPVRAGFRIKL